MQRSKNSKNDNTIDHQPTLEANKPPFLIDLSYTVSRNAQTEEFFERNKKEQDSPKIFLVLKGFLKNYVSFEENI
ncbi:hypothetical protein WN51_11669 [Melipona quadrifasciata]|uniref:Uncharacterized protein n=1 Tax=Melipona quadrifasciata TaxID=166423 RepID=A0A0N0BHJ9_9HYME|nr:hypothetical protein WN51_11669 [Melipona quadrifasciata]